MHWPKYCVSLAWIAGLCFASSVARAQTPATSVVELTIAGSDDDVRALRVTLREALSGSSVQLLVKRVRAIDPRTVSRPLASATHAPHLWIDRSEAKQASLYLTSADGRRVFVRNFELEHDLDPVALELLGLVARNSLTAMLSGDAVGVSREEYERSLPPASPPATQSTASIPRTAGNAPAFPRNPARSRNWHFGALYELEALGASAAQHSAGAQLEWQPSWFSLGLSAELRAPLQVGSGPVRVRLRSRAAKLFVALPLRLSDQVTLAVGSAFGVDWFRVEGLEDGPGAMKEPAYSVADGVLRAFASFRYRLGALELAAGLGADLSLINARYYVLRGDQRETVFTPWRVRPLGTLGVSACF